MRANLVRLIDGLLKNDGLVVEFASDVNVSGTGSHRHSTDQTTLKGKWNIRISIFSTRIDLDPKQFSDDRFSILNFDTCIETRIKNEEPRVIVDYN